MGPATFKWNCGAEQMAKNDEESKNGKGLQIK